MSERIDTKTKKRIRRKPKRIWHLVTNHQNMLYMLAAGMVMSPAGFRGKYYTDPLSVYPGWITLFRDKINIPNDVFIHSTSERKHLLPCIASLDLSDIAGPARMLSSNGQTRDIKSPTARKRKDDIAIQVRTPLPISLLSSINFQSDEDKQAFESIASDVSNVNLLTQQINVTEKLFSSDTGIAWPAEPSNDFFQESSTDVFPAFSQALGGIVAMLYQFANRSDFGQAVFNIATGCQKDKDVELLKDDPILLSLPEWTNGDDLSNSKDIRVKLFWGVIDAIVVSQNLNARGNPIDVVLDHLEGQVDLLDEQDFRPRLERLINDMRSFLGLGGGTITELLEHHKGSLSRSLLLFCLRDNCPELLEFSHPLLHESDYAAAGILFGARDSWLRLPNDLRRPHISSYVSSLMANIAHNNQGDRLFLDMPAHPTTLRELFVTTPAEREKEKNTIGIRVASLCGWDECIQTRIELNEGSHPESFNQTDLRIIIQGKIKDITETLDWPSFFQRLAQYPPIENEIELALRNELSTLHDSTLNS